MRGATTTCRTQKRRSCKFQSTRPMRGATAARSHIVSYSRVFQSTRPMRGATLGGYNRRFDSIISIHAPHAGRDMRQRSPVSSLQKISIHAPHAGRDRGNAHRPSRRLISIHAPHAGRDVQMLCVNVSDENFNPRAPCGARPRGIDLKSRLEYFNPRAPCGARPPEPKKVITPLKFQSTRPMRGATQRCRSQRKTLRISIHAPHAGRDNCSRFCIVLIPIFQSTRPMRGATEATFFILC